MLLPLHKAADSAPATLQFPPATFFQFENPAYTTCWKQFLSTDTAKALVLDWETKLQAVNSYIYITPSDNDSLEEDNNADNKREEWMLMAELNIQTNDFYEQSTLVQQASGISTFHNKGNQCNAFVDKQRQKTEVVLTLYAQQEL